MAPASKTRRKCPGKEVHVVDEPRVDDAGPEPQVVEQRHPDVVDEVADVARRSTAHEKERDAAHHRCHPGQSFDSAKRIAECPGDLPHLVALERCFALLRALPHDLDLLGHRGLGYDPGILRAGL
jgi:hypothetical protein